MKFVPELSMDENLLDLIIEAKTYEIYSGPNGPYLRVLGKLNSDTIRTLRREKITGIEILSMAVDESVDLDVLRLMPELRSLSILYENQIDWTPIQHLKQIEHLNLVARRYKPQPLDFTKFRNLQTARISWHPEWESVLSCTSLRGLMIESSKGVPEFDLGRLQRLRELRLKQCSNLRRVICSPGQNLESLAVLYCHSFEAVSPKKVLKKLKYAFLGGNSHFEVESLGKCKELVRLSMHGVGKLKSLKFLAGCRRLEVLGMSFSTQIEDGDLTPLLKLPKLRRLGFKPFKNYSHTLNEIKELIGIA